MTIKVTNPLLPFDASKGERNPNHSIAGTAINGKAEKRVVFKPGTTATVQGARNLPGIIPLWVWNQFRDSPVGSRYIREGRLIVKGDKVADQMIKEFKSEQRETEKALKTDAKPVQSDTEPAKV